MEKKAKDSSTRRVDQNLKILEMNNKSLTLIF